MTDDAYRVPPKPANMGAIPKGGDRQAMVRKRAKKLFKVVDGTKNLQDIIPLVQPYWWWRSPAAKNPIQRLKGILQSVNCRELRIEKIYKTDYGFTMEVVWSGRHIPTGKMRYGALTFVAENNSWWFNPVSMLRVYDNFQHAKDVATCRTPKKDM